MDRPYGRLGYFIIAALALFVVAAILWPALWIAWGILTIVAMAAAFITGQHGP